MKLDRLRLSAVVIAGTLIAILVVSPAIGGPSLKQWLKKRVGNEVTKQLNSKRFDKRLRSKTGRAGQNGPAGASGVPGARGAPGAGTGIVARASLSGPAVSSGDVDVVVPIPLADASWTQAGGELDEVYAEATHTGMAETCFGGADSGAALIVIDLPGGKQIGMQVPAGTPAGTTSTPEPTVVMPSLAGAHTLTASVQDGCLDSESTTVTGINIYVVAHR